MTHTIKGKCGKCGKNKMVKEEWEDWFPLNTFHGETKRQLVECIHNILEQQKKEVREKTVYDFTKWWSDDQTKNKEDYIKRASRSEAISVAKKYLDNLKK
jgi:hypothetical protein